MTWEGGFAPLPKLPPEVAAAKPPLGQELD